MLLDEKVIDNISYYANIQIAPCTSLWGGLIASEIIKATGKFTPLNQWQHLLFSEAIPYPANQHPQVKDRYFSYRLLFGDEFINKVANSTTLLIGAGSIGC